MQDLADKVDDLTRLLSRQGAALSGLTDARAGAAGPDTPLLVELHALYCDAMRCAATARYRRERDAFLALAGGLSRLLSGRGGAVVAPAAGDAFDPATMAAVEVADTADPACDRTVAVLLEPGLRVVERSTRPARVSVLRHRPAPSATPA